MLPYATIVENALTDIETWNNMPHSVHTHMSRWQVFCEKQHPQLKPTNYAAILPYIGYKTQTSCNVGIIRLDRKEFLLGNDGKICLGGNLINLMKQVEGKDIEVYWLDDNQGAVMKALVYIGGHLICEALPKPRYNRATIERGPEDDAARTIMSAYEATITSYGKRVKQSIDKVTVIDERPAMFNDFKMPGLKKNEPEKPKNNAPLIEEQEDDYFATIPAPRKSLIDRY